MMVTIYGPNLQDQSRGSFRVHRDGCGHDAPLSLGGLPAHGWAIDASSKAAATLAVYADQIAEGSGYRECRDDLFFEVCCQGVPAFPEGDAEAELREVLEEERLGAEDHAAAMAEEAADVVPPMVLELIGVASALLAVSARLLDEARRLGGAS